ncbi:MAG: hypothetical protein QOC93_2284 [Actinomycetota bacterium]|nr:hypothetical protein [Actinomycetota bacterium]
MTGAVISLPYPHAHNDCDVCGQSDDGGQATFPGVGERPAL